MRHRLRRPMVAVAALLAAGACEDSTDVDPIVIEASGTVAGLVFLDTNGNGTLDAADEPITGIRVVTVEAIQSSKEPNCIPMDW